MPIKLLVVEDVPIARKMIQIILTQLGYQFDMTENGAETMQLFKENHYDLVFMDLGLPDINGIEVAKELRKLEEGGSSVPIVALTAHHTEQDKKRGLAAGMQEFMLKPLTKEIAQSIINKYIKK